MAALDANLTLPKFADAMHLFAKNSQVDSHNSTQLKLLQSKGVEVLRLVAGHGWVGEPGQVTRERISKTQIPTDKDNCGGLAESLEVSPLDCVHLAQLDTCIA